MKTTISKTITFDAAHRLPHVHEGHKCGRMHGHTYTIDVRLEGEPTQHEGWFIDYSEIGAALLHVFHIVDHQTLNDIPGLENPTTEVLCAWMWPILKGRLPQMVALRIYESSTTWCEVRDG